MGLNKGSLYKYPKVNKILERPKMLSEKSTHCDHRRGCSGVQDPDRIDESCRYGRRSRSRQIQLPGSQRSSLAVCDDG